MPRSQKVALVIAGIVLLVWAVLYFLFFLFFTGMPYGAILYP